MMIKYFIGNNYNKENIKATEILLSSVGITEKFDINVLRQLDLIVFKDTFTINNFIIKYDKFITFFLLDEKNIIIGIAIFEIKNIFIELHVLFCEIYEKNKGCILLHKIKKIAKILSLKIQINNWF